jgi:protein-disulfide isomerase
MRRRGDGPDAADRQATYVPPQAELMDPGPLGERALGKADAPVTVIEYVSLTCPALQQFPEERIPAREEGVHRHRQGPLHRAGVSHRPLPPGTRRIANRCAPEDKYFFLLTSSSPGSREWVSQDVRLDAIFSVAKSGGLSRETFDNCLSNQTMIDGLNEVKQRGRQFGVIGTPTFFINGRKAQGEVTFEEIKAMIEQTPAPSSS